MEERLTQIMNLLRLIHHTLKPKKNFKCLINFFITETINWNDLPWKIQSKVLKFVVFDVKQCTKLLIVCKNLKLFVINHLKTFIIFLWVFVLNFSGVQSLCLILSECREN